MTGPGTNRYGSIGELKLGDEVWAWVRGSCRRSRVVNIGRRRVTVAFKLARRNPRAVFLQAIRLDRLRRERPASSYGVVTTPAPTDAEISGLGVGGLVG